MSNYEYSFERERLDIAMIHRVLAASYWSEGIPRAVVQKAIENSLCIGVFAGPTQIGFARVVTDCATFAYLADVFVIPEHTGNGVAQQMVRRLLAHAQLQGLRRIMLATRDAHSLYAKLGFKPLAAPDRFMERHVAQIYIKPAASSA